ncbi:unnamed protein product [Symbiodinium natans]|uniref:Uncharacterized protein n=1 Tax=Symbiodinium natans TaxID=878477 RepID=A0A812G8T1_9DINO|nr:unnamed protein product [Symbiodinium natans]
MASELPSSRHALVVTSLFLTLPSFHVHAAEVEGKAPAVQPGVLRLKETRMYALSWNARGVPGAPAPEALGPTATSPAFATPVFEHKCISQTVLVDADSWALPFPACAREK